MMLALAPAISAFKPMPQGGLRARQRKSPIIRDADFAGTGLTSDPSFKKEIIDAEFEDILAGTLNHLAGNALYQKALEYSFLAKGKNLNIFA